MLIAPVWQFMFFAFSALLPIADWVIRFAMSAVFGTEYPLVRVAPLKEFGKKRKA